jgi:hypothetical protein
MPRASIRTGTVVAAAAVAVHLPLWPLLAILGTLAWIVQHPERTERAAALLAALLGGDGPSRPAR